MSHCPICLSYSSLFECTDGFACFENRLLFTGLLVRDIVQDVTSAGNHSVAKATPLSANQQV